MLKEHPLRRGNVLTRRNVMIFIVLGGLAALGLFMKYGQSSRSPAAGGASFALEIRKDWKDRVMGLWGSSGEDLVDDDFGGDDIDITKLQMFETDPTKAQENKQSS